MHVFSQIFITTNWWAQFLKISLIETRQIAIIYEFSLNKFPQNVINSYLKLNSITQSN